MQHTSEAQDLKSFFTREQLYAFSQPPSQAAISQVKKQGSDQDYLSGEYIRLVLNRYIGPGMYDLEVSLVGEPMKEIVKKDKWENRQKVGTIDNVAVTANVSVVIVIYAPDGSGRTRRYSAVGSHTMYGAAEAGAGAIIGNAIKSAETSGLKRAVQPLGRAFGLDLKNKVSDRALPPGIGHFRRLLEEREAAQRDAASGQPALTHSEQPAIEMKPAQNGREQTERTERTERVDAPAPDTTREQEPRNRAAADQDAPRAENRAERARQEQAPAAQTRDAEPQARQQRQEAPAHEPEVSGGRSQNRAENAAAQPERRQERRQPAGEEGQPQSTHAPTESAGAAQAEEPRREVEWELSMTPGNYADWVTCIKTLTKRVNAMTSEKELENFAKRNSKLISALPSYPAEGDQQAKDFGQRWKTVMARRYRELGLEVPEKYAPQAEAKQPA